MGSFIVLKFVSLTIFFEGLKASTECDKMPPGASSMCCNMPSFKDIAMIETIVGHFAPQKMDEYLMECKINEEFAKEFNVIKDGKFDMDMALQKINDQFEKPTWRKVYRESLQQCLSKVNDNYSDIQKKFESEPFNIDKSKCDVRFMAVFFCMQMNVYINCPQEDLIKGQDCDDVMHWMQTCHRDAYSFREVASSVRKAT